MEGWRTVSRIAREQSTRMHRAREILSRMPLLAVSRSDFAFNLGPRATLCLIYLSDERSLLQEQQQCGNCKHLRGKLIVFFFLNNSHNVVKVNRWCFVINKDIHPFMQQNAHDCTNAQRVQSVNIVE